ncbi:NAD-dependent epimerase/dehydratase family protein [Chloroflexota bacterium]
MKIFITGAESFVGRELVSQCEKQEIEVCGVDLAGGSKPNFYQGDIRSRDIVGIIPEGIDAIVHLAALSKDPVCKNRGYECFDINVMGTLNLIEAAQKRRAKQFIFASSEWVYDNCNKDEIKSEESFINIANHTSEYALSKLVSEANLRQKYQYGFCPTTVLRFGIIYGLRKEDWSAVESLFHTVKSNEEVVVGSLKTGRHFIHVSDIASGVIESLGLGGFNIINLEGDALITLGDIIETGGKILNRNPKIKESNPAAISLRRVSNAKAKKLLQWQPMNDLESGLRSLIPAI